MMPLAKVFQTFVPGEGRQVDGCRPAEKLEGGNDRSEVYTSWSNGLQISTSSEDAIVEVYLAKPAADNDALVCPYLTHR